MTRKIVTLVFACVAGLLAPILTPGHSATAQTFRVEPAPEWDALFARRSGWTGADGIYSIPLNGIEGAGGYAEGRTLFVFSDTFVGNVGPEGKRQLGSTLVNNTLAYRPAGAPAARPMAFFVAETFTGAPRASFEPTVPGAAPDEWYWMKDGIAIDGTVYLLASRFRRDPVAYIFREGLTLIELDANDISASTEPPQREVPLTIDPIGDRGPVVYGASIMPNTTTAKAPAPDGYIYVYGTREDPGNKLVMVARVRPEQFADIGSWRFWNGEDWVADIAAATPITDRAAVELSVSPLENGKFLMVHQLDQLDRRIVVRVADRPEGPFGDYQTVFSCPEAEVFRQIYCYNAKAHPHLSEPGSLLVSYNVNTLKFEDNFRFADIYRPRFFRIIVNN